MPTKVRRALHGNGKSKSIATLANELEKKINFKLESIKLALTKINDDTISDEDREIIINIVLGEMKDLEPVQSLIEYQWPSLHSAMSDIQGVLNGNS